MISVIDALGVLCIFRLADERQCIVPRSITGQADHAFFIGDGASRRPSEA